jgi:hypothetical protein
MPTQPQGCWDHWAACKPIERSDQPVKRAISKKRKRKEKKRKEKKRKEKKRKEKKRKESFQRVGGNV